MHQGVKPWTTAVRVLPVLAVAYALAGCGSTAGPAKGSTAAVTAKLLVKVSSVHPETGLTLLGGPTFDPETAIGLS
jgi:hypothetical protein